MLPSTALLKPMPIDADLLAFFNRPGTPWLDAIMSTASNRYVLLGVAALAVIWLWIKSPHGSSRWPSARAI